MATGAPADLIQQLINALSAAYSPQTTDAVRIQASQYLESFKTTQPPLVVMNISLELIRNSAYNTHIRHYGFQSFQYTLHQHYESFTSMEKTSIKTQLIDLIKPQPNLTPPTLNLPAELYFQPPQYIASSLINYQHQQASILASKMVGLIAQIVIFDWPHQWPDLFPTLLSFLEQCPSLDYTLFLLEIFNKIIDSVGQPSLDIQEKRRKEVFSAVIPQLQQILPYYFAHLETVLSIIACDIPTIQKQFPYLYQFFPQLPSALINYANQRSNTIVDPLFTTYIKHVLQITLYLNQHIVERVHFSPENLTLMVSLMATMLSLPETCDEISEHVLLLLQRRQGMSLHLLPETLLRLWQTLIELSARILSRQSICNDLYKLFPQRTAATSQTLSFYLQRQPLLIKVLTSLQQLISSYSTALNGIIISQQETVTRLELLQLQNPQTFHTTPDNMNSLNISKQILSGIDQLRTTLLQVLCRASLDLDCHDFVCSTAIQSLLECTHARLYSMYISNSYFVQNNMIEPLLSEIWQVILANTDRERIAHLQGKSRGGVDLKGDVGNGEEEVGNSKISNVAPSVSTGFDVLGLIRSSLQALVKQLVTRSPHLILKFVSMTYHTSISALLDIAKNEQQQIVTQNVGKTDSSAVIFPTTIENHSKSIHYIFQTSSEFNQTIYPTHHFGYRTFFTSQSFLDLDSLTSNTKTIFQQLQSLFNKVPRHIEQTNPDHTMVIELIPSLDFTSDWASLSYNYLESLLQSFVQLHTMLISCPIQCLGYQTFTINILAKLTPLYSLSQPHLQQTVMLFLQIGRLNPNNVLSNTSYIGSTRHDGLHYNQFFISSTQQLITNPHETAADSLIASSGTGKIGINMGPLLDLRKHALHAILHLTKHLPQAFESTYTDFCQHILQIIHAPPIQLQSSVLSSTLPNQTPTSTDQVTIPTEAVVLIEIILCLGLYFNNETITMSVYHQLLLPHIEYIKNSLDVAYFLADPFRFSTLLYGSKDEYKLIQLQLLQWGNINKNPSQAAHYFGSHDTTNTPHHHTTSNSSSISTDIQSTSGDRENVLPKPFSASINIPTCTFDPTTPQQYPNSFDNRFQSLRKQILFSFHTIQCVTKLLLTQSTIIDSFDLTTLPPQFPQNDPLSQQQFTQSQHQSQYDQAIKEYSRLQQQGKNSREVLFKITTELFSPTLRFFVMYLVCTTETHLSQLFNRLQPLSIGSGFEYFLALFINDRFVTSTQSTLPSNQFDSSLASQQSTDQIWSQGDHILHGFLDTTYLPSDPGNSANIPSNDLSIAAAVKTLVNPADKSQSLLRHLWTWGDSMFESLTQLLSAFTQIANDLVSIDLLCIPHQVQQFQQSSFFTGTPSQLFQTITQQTLQPLPSPSQHIFISQASNLAQFNSFFWILIFGLIPTLPLRKQRLIVQRVLTPLFRLFPYKSINTLQQQYAQLQQNSNQISTEPLGSTPALLQQRFSTIDSQLTQQLVSKQLLSYVTPYLLSTMVSTTVVSLLDSMMWSHFAQNNTQSTNTTLSPTLSYIADAISSNSIPTLRRLRGVTSNVEHLRFLPNQFVVSIQSHGGKDKNDLTLTTPIYNSLGSFQHLIATTPLSTTYHQQLELNPTDTLSRLHVSVINFVPPSTTPLSNPLIQSQSTLLDTILNEIQQSTQRSKMLNFPGEFDQLRSSISSILQRYDFSRLITTLQHQLTNPSQTIPKNFSNDPLHNYIEQLDCSEINSYLASLQQVFQIFVVPTTNSERNMNNAHSMLKQSQMFLALPLCHKLAEHASVTPQVCYQLSSIWEISAKLNYTSSMDAGFRHLLLLLRYVGVVVCYSSVCLAQRQQQQLNESQGHPKQPPFVLDAENMGLYYRLLYYQPLLSPNNKDIKNNHQSTSSPLLSTNASHDPQYNGLLVKKSPQDMKQLIATSKSDIQTIFNTDDYWLHLCNVQEQLHLQNAQNGAPSGTPNQTSTQTGEVLGITDAFLLATPRLVEWLKHLFKKCCQFFQRHFYATRVLDLTEKQQQTAQTFGSPIFTDHVLDQFVIVSRDVLTLLSQCQSYVSFDHIQQLLHESIPSVDTSMFTQQQQQQQPNQIQIPQSQPQPTLQQYLSPETIALLVNYARKTDSDEMNHDGSGGNGTNSDNFYFSHLTSLSKKGVMSEKNTSAPMLPIPSQTRPAKDQFKGLLYKIFAASIGQTTHNQ